MKEAQATRKAHDEVTKLLFFTILYKSMCKRRAYSTKNERNNVFLFFGKLFGIKFIAETNLKAELNG